MAHLYRCVVLIYCLVSFTADAMRIQRKAKRAKNAKLAAADLVELGDDLSPRRRCGRHIDCTSGKCCPKADIRVKKPTAQKQITFSEGVCLEDLKLMVARYVEGSSFKNESITSVSPAVSVIEEDKITTLEDGTRVWLACQMDFYGLQEAAPRAPSKPLMVMDMPVSRTSTKETSDRKLVPSVVEDLPEVKISSSGGRPSHMGSYVDDDRLPSASGMTTGGGSYVEGDRLPSASGMTTGGGMSMAESRRMSNARDVSPSHNKERGFNATHNGSFDGSPSLHGSFNEEPQLALMPLTGLNDDLPQSRDLMTMASWVESKSDSVGEVSIVESYAKILQFDAGSGAVEFQNEIAPEADVLKLHLIATDLKFRPGGFREGMTKTGNNREMALKYGEELVNPDDCRGLAGEIKRLQDDSVDGSKFVICIAFGTSATEGVLAKQGRPMFAKNRALNIQKHLQVAMDDVGASGTIIEPQVQYGKDRVAGILMKSYTGTEPPCVLEGSDPEIKIPNAKM